MGLVNSSNLAAANTTFETTVNDIFSNGAPGVYQTFTDVVPCEGTSIELVVVDGLPAVREWVGPKQYADLRAYKVNVALRKWEATFELKREFVDGDKSGVVGKRLSDFARRQGFMYDKIVIDALVANAIAGYDASNLLADAHANQATGATADNLTTSALSFAEFRTMHDALSQMKDGSGEPLGIYPTHLLCGSLTQRTAMEVTGSNRPSPIGNTGTVDASSSVVAVHSFENYIGGSCQVIVSNRITGNEWFAFDLSKGTKPYLLAEFRKPMAVSQTDPDSPARFENDVYRWSIECDASPLPGAWQLAYGSVTA